MTNAEHTTLGFMQVWLDIVTSANCKSQLQFLHTNNYQLFLGRDIYSTSIGYEQMQYLVPTCIKASLVGVSIKLRPVDNEQFN